jgi:hypothetical protein
MNKIDVMSHTLIAELLEEISPRDKEEKVRSTINAKIIHCRMKNKLSILDLKIIENSVWLFFEENGFVSDKFEPQFVVA